MELIKALAVVANFFIPGLGTLMLGKVGKGMTQLFLFGLGFMVMIFLVPFVGPFVGPLVGALICFCVWVWGLVSAARAASQPAPAAP